jgi:hypothetical protein
MRWCMLPTVVLIREAVKPLWCVRAREREEREERLRWEEGEKKGFAAGLRRQFPGEKST